MELFQEIAHLPMETVVPGIRRFVSTLERVMSVYFEIQPGVRVAEHAHPHEQIGILIQGKTRWRIQGREIIIQGPALYRIPSQVPHEMEVLGEEPALALDVFSPIREDFLKAGAPSYMQSGPTEERA